MTLRTEKAHAAAAPRSYHHGNLREALIQAALELIAEKGTTGFAIADAARRAGVSPAAPYRHFRDRDELLGMVALRGFEAFEVALSRAWDEGQPNPFVALDRLGKAYLEFARRHPAFYAVMFEGGVPAGVGPEARAASERCFAIVLEAAERISAILPADSRPVTLMVALHIWSMTHAAASLFGRGEEARRVAPVTPEEILESHILIYFRGLGIIAPSPKG